MTTYTVYIRNTHTAAEATLTTRAPHPVAADLWGYYEGLGRGWKSVTVIVRPK